MFKLSNLRQGHGAGHLILGLRDKVLLASTILFGNSLFIIFFCGYLVALVMTMLVPKGRHYFFGMKTGVFLLVMMILDFPLTVYALYL